METRLATAVSLNLTENNAEEGIKTYCNLPCQSYHPTDEEFPSLITKEAPNILRGIDTSFLHRSSPIYRSADEREMLKNVGVYDEIIVSGV